MTNSQNQTLIASVTVKEISKAIWRLKTDKKPGSDLLENFKRSLKLNLSLFYIKKIIGYLGREFCQIIGVTQ